MLVYCNLTCPSCGSQAKILRVECLLLMIVGMVIGYYVGLNNELLFQNIPPTVAMIIVGRYTSAIILGILGYKIACRRIKCSKCKVILLAS